MPSASIRDVGAACRSVGGHGLERPESTRRGVGRVDRAREPGHRGTRLRSQRRSPQAPRRREHHRGLRGARTARTRSSTTSSAARRTRPRVTTSQCCYGNTDEDVARERLYLDLFEEQQVRGVLISPYGDIQPRLERLRARGIPAVLVDRFSGRRPVQLGLRRQRRRRPDGGRAPHRVRPAAHRVRRRSRSTSARSTTGSPVRASRPRTRPCPSTSRSWRPAA